MVKHIIHKVVLYTNIDQTLVNSLHGLLNCALGGLDVSCYYNRAYNTRPVYTHATPCNAFGIYSGVLYTKH